MGKPVYDETSVADRLYHQSSGSEPSTPPPRSAFIDEHGNKIVPKLSFSHLKSHLDGPRIKTWAWVMNESPFDVEVVKIALLGQQQDIHRILRPGEGHEVAVYAGPAIASDHDHRARVYCVIHQNADSFLAEYTIEYTRGSNGTYLIEELHPAYQPRDI